MRNQIASRTASETAIDPQSRAALSIIINALSRRVSSPTAGDVALPTDPDVRRKQALALARRIVDRSPLAELQNLTGAAREARIDRQAHMIERGWIYKLAHTQPAA